MTTPPLGRQNAGTAAHPDPEDWVDRHGDALFRYALSRVRDRQRAEDLVQDTFLAAYRAREQFQGRASERTWLIGILKRKIIDLHRKRSEQPVTDLAQDDGLDGLFTSGGKWKVPVTRWADDPEELVRQREFQEVLRGCLAAMPARLADAFALRELEDLSSEEVRKVLHVSASNLWVLLHRARLRLWRCLSVRWAGA